jgi:hypothetical protein
MRIPGSLAVLAVMLVALMHPVDSWARIKLITLPVRERVEIQLDHASSTLVEEERTVPLVKGVNQVDFSWANTQIDPNTILFRVVAAAGERALDVKVLSVSYPPNEAALVWSVSASDSGPVRVRISYLLGNLSKSFNYRALSSKDETTLTLSQYIRLQNFANEEFGSTNLWAGFGNAFHKPVGINQTMEMLMAKFSNVPVRKTYTCDPEEFGWLDQPQQKLRVPMHYVIKNDKASQLGTAALPYGKVRIFIQGGADEGSTAFLGEDWGQFTPVDDEMKLYLGVAQDVVVKRTIDRNNRVRVAGNLFNHEVLVKYEIENFKDKPVALDVQENVRSLRNQLRGDSGRDVEWELGGETTFTGGADRDKSTFERVVFHANLPARDQAGKAEKLVHKFHLILKNEW